MARPMLVRTVILFLVCFAGSAAAFCTDAAAPGVEWNRCLFDERSMPGANLAGAKIRSSSFKRANLDEADFSGAFASRAKFISAGLRGTRFDKARLNDADFTKADLRGAFFKNADLRRARFFRSRLEGADFTGARLKQTDFFDADLSGAVWTDGKHICAPGSVGQCR